MDFVIPGIAGVTLAYNLWSGELIGQLPRITRREKPRQYWGANLFLVFVIGLSIKITNGNIEVERRNNAAWEAAEAKRIEDSTRDAAAAEVRQAAQAGAESELAYLRGAIERDPTNFDAHVQVDRFLSVRGRLDEVIAMWTTFLERTPGHAIAYFERGGAYYHKRDLVAAKADAQRACDLGHAPACTQAARLR